MISLEKDVFLQTGGNVKMSYRHDKLIKYWKDNGKLPIETSSINKKQPRYKSKSGVDWIDECADSFTVEEFRGAMKFTIGKYNKRIGKKDTVIQEIRKMKDYCARWEEYEQRLEDE